MGAGAQHSFEEHRGELEIRIEAPTLPDLFAEAGRALAGVMHSTPLEAPVRWSDEVAVTARDREALLVGWLNELVFRSELAKVIFTDFDITQLSERQLVARIRGTQMRELRNPVKAATYHGLSITEHAGGFTAKVILDV
ncbi:archease [Anaeromyxobacter oryzae]|uniref:Protein archease n=1 Tax=Anaeromyxobacter oryzae TaxID=2918170 RepID=A0ABM7X018_9BACT|nr:archease [Anaeromyxobacter oryzae]BDG05111.1 protein archease [Anaeromyxobacter oryzae]